MINDTLITMHFPQKEINNVNISSKLHFSFISFYYSFVFILLTLAQYSVLTVLLLFFSVVYTDVYTLIFFIYFLQFHTYPYFLHFCFVHFFLQKTSTVAWRIDSERLEIWIIFMSRQLDSEYNCYVVRTWPAVLFIKDKEAKKKMKKQFISVSSNEYDIFFFFIFLQK